MILSTVLDNIRRHRKETNKGTRIKASIAIVLIRVCYFCRGASFRYRCFADLPLYEKKDCCTKINLPSCNSSYCIATKLNGKIIAYSAETPASAPPLVRRKILRVRPARR